MNTNNNLYIFIYASVLVIVVASILSIAAINLQPYQEQNVKIEKMQNILTSVGIASTPDDAEESFKKYINRRFVVGTDGVVKSEKTSGDMIDATDKNDAFNIKLKKQLSLDEKDRQLPLFECQKDDGSKNLIIPVRGKGLWGPIWGYVALEADFNTVYGAVFAHKAETPGLGADIDKAWFQEPFKGKKLFDQNGEFISITVYKGGKGAAAIAGDIEHGVDAISGGTITSKGLEDMLKQDCLVNYKNYLLNQRN